MKVKDINDCEDCPLKDNDCVKIFMSSGSGLSIEPPCYSWNSDTDVYEGMYDYE